MNKDAVINRYFQKRDQLTVTDKRYQSLVDTLITWLLRTDEIEKDVTTKALQIAASHKSQANIISKKAVTLAGVEEAVYLLKKYTTLHYSVVRNDGEQLSTGETIMEIQGATSEILAYERVLLNIL